MNLKNKTAKGKQKYPDICGEIAIRTHASPLPPVPVRVVLETCPEGKNEDVS